MTLAHYNADLRLLLSATMRPFTRALTLVEEVDLALESFSPKFRKLFSPEKRSVHNELLILGVDVISYNDRPGYIKNNVHGKNFFERYEKHLEFILRDAHHCWKRKLKATHEKQQRAKQLRASFRMKQLEEKTVRLNLAWQFVEKEFAKYDCKL